MKSTPVDNFAGLLRTGQYCSAAAARPAAIAHLRSGPAHCGESAQIEFNAQVGKMIAAGGNAEAVHFEINRCTG